MGREKQRSPVVVGVDGADHTQRAIEWAAIESAHRHVPLRLVHAYVWPLLRIPPVLTSLGPPDGLREHSSDLVAESVDAARFTAPDVPLESLIETDFPEDLLARESRNASHLVIGSRSLGTVGRLIAGSVTTRVIRQARCPVAVIGRSVPTPRADAPVIVGVDGSSHSVTALGAAVDLATHHDTELHVVHVAPAQTSGWHVDVDQMVAPWQVTHPELRIRVLLLEGRTDRVLVELSKAGGALVVGARGLRDLTGAFIGSVSQAVLVRARCPVVVTPAGASTESVESS